METRCFEKVIFFVKDEREIEKVERQSRSAEKKRMKEREEEGFMERETPTVRDFAVMGIKPDHKWKHLGGITYHNSFGY